MENTNTPAPTRTPEVVFDLEDILDARYVRLALLYVALLISITSVVCSFYEVDRGIPVALVLAAYVALICYGIAKERNEEAQAWAAGQRHEWGRLKEEVERLRPVAERCRSVEMRYTDVEAALKDAKRLLAERSAALAERSAALEEARAELEKEKKSRAGAISAAVRKANRQSE